MEFKCNYCGKVYNTAEEMAKCILADAEKKRKQDYLARQSKEREKIETIRTELINRTTQLRRDVDAFNKKYGELFPEYKMSLVGLKTGAVQEKKSECKSNCNCNKTNTATKKSNYKTVDKDYDLGNGDTVKIKVGSNDENYLNKVLELFSAYEDNKEDSWKRVVKEDNANAIKNLFKKYGFDFDE